MLDDAGVGRLPVGVVDHGVALEIRHIQHLRLKPDGAVAQRAEAIVKVAVNRAGVNDLVRQRVQLGSVLQIVHIQPHLDAIQHILHHLGVAAHGNALKPGVEVVIVKGKTHRQTLDDKGRQLPAGAPPLLFGVALHQLFINIRADEGNGLFLQILRLRNPGGLPLTGNLRFRLLWSRHAPHFIEGIHVEGQGVQLPVVIRHRGIGVAVKFREPVDVLPRGLVVGVENMGAVGMYLDSLDLLGIHIAADVTPPVDHKHGLPRRLHLPGKDSAEQPRPHDQIIIPHG